MHKFRQFATWFTIVLCLGVMLFSTFFYVVSSTLARNAAARLTRAEMEAGVRGGMAMLSIGAEKEETVAALRAAVNSPLNAANFFYLFFDDEGQLLCYSDGAAPYLSALTPNRMREALHTGEILSLDVGAAGKEICLMGQSGPAGMVLAGKTLQDSNSAMESFRSLLFQYALPLAILLALVLVMLSQRLLRPVNMLVEAAQRISEGETVTINEKKLSVELRPLGGAFNHMSRRLSSLIGALTYERDTVSLVLEGLDEGVIVMDEAGDVLRENRMALRLLGGRQTQEYVRMADRLRQAVTCGQEPLRLQRGERTLLCMFLPMPVRPEGRRGALAVVRDVTEHERLERTRREYVANISHELRTPLASMRGITEGLRDGLVTGEEERMRHYTLLLGEVKRLSRLVDDLLELSSLQSSSAAFAPERVDTAETLLELHDRTQNLAQKKRVALSLALPAEPLPHVQANEDRLQQVLTILLDNAVKFTPEGGRITLGAEPAVRGVRFFVRDTGVGMDEYTRKHAFERFHQADRSHSAKGSGLGLAIAREVMQHMNSRIFVNSQEGKGSEFYFVLPCWEEKKA